MRKLASLVNIMNDPKSLEPASLDAEGIAVKSACFAQFASPKKRNGGASFVSDGFVEIVNKKKRSQSANVGKLDGFAPNSQVRSKEGFGSTKTTIKEADFPNQIMNDPKSLEPASLHAEGIAVKGASFAQFASSNKRNGGASFGNDCFAEITNKKKCSQNANVGKEDVFAPNSQVKSKEGFESSKATIKEAGFPNQANMRRFRNHAENQQAKSGPSVQAQFGKTVAQSGKTVSQSGQRVPTQSGKHIELDSEYLLNLESAFPLNMRKVFLLNLSQDQINCENVYHLSLDINHQHN